jgi:phosphatidylglycerophosphate synthase
MDKIPQRLGIVRYYRGILDYLGRVVSPPPVSPAVYELIGLSLSVIYLYLTRPGHKIVFLALILLCDWCDGVVARQYHRESRRGYLMDLTVDRLSCGFIFFKELGTPIGFLFYFLWLANIVLSFYSLKSGRHLVMPLRFAYLLVLLIRII